MPDEANTEVELKQPSLEHAHRDYLESRDLASNLFWGDFTGKEKLDPFVEKVSSVVTLDAPTIADVYLISLASWGKNLIWEQIHREGTTPQKWSKAQLEQGKNDEATSLLYETYAHVDEIAAKHIIAGITFLCDFSHPTPEVFPTYETIINRALEGKSPREILDSLPSKQAINLLKRVVGPDRIYRGILQSLDNLNNLRTAAKETLDYESVIRGMTQLHNVTHHWGGVVLERLMGPKDKDKPYDLLLRFASRNPAFNLFSARKFAGPEARKLYAAWQHYLISSPEEAVKEFTPEEEAFLLADELVKEVSEDLRAADDERANRRAFALLTGSINTLQKYPLFRTIKQLSEPEIMIVQSIGEESFRVYFDILKQAAAQRTMDVQKILHGVVEQGINLQRFWIFDKEMYKFLDEESKSKVWIKFGELLASPDYHEEESALIFLVYHPDLLERNELSVRQKYEALRVLRASNNYRWIFDKLKSANPSSFLIWLFELPYYLPGADKLKELNDAISRIANDKQLLQKIGKEEISLFHSIIKERGLTSFLSDYVRQNKHVLERNVRLKEVFTGFTD